MNTIKRITAVLAAATALSSSALSAAALDEEMFVQSEAALNISSNYTGLVNTDSGLRYYRGGEEVYGWSKINGSWYHFGSNALAATGKTKIGSGNYYFTKSGKWRGRYSKKAKRPDDFNITLTVTNTSFGSGWTKTIFSTDSDSFCVSGGDCEQLEYTELGVSGRDMQAMYSMLDEYKVFDMDEAIDYDSTYYTLLLDKYKRTDKSYSPEEDDSVENYTINITCGGKNYTFNATENLKYAQKYPESDGAHLYSIIQSIKEYSDNFIYDNYAFLD